MALTERKKKGLIMVITGAVLIAAGAILMFTTSTPGWVAGGLDILALVLGAVGLPLLIKPEV